MRRAFLLALLISLIPALSGCTAPGRDAERFESWRAELGESVSCTAQLTARFDDAADTYTITCTQTAQACTLSIAEPELLSGVTFTQDETGTVASVDGRDFSLGTLTPAGLSPLSALPEMIDALRSGTAELTWRETLEDQPMLAVQFLPDVNGDTVTVYFSWQTLTPACAEIQNGNETVVKCIITDWDH